MKLGTGVLLGLSCIFLGITCLCQSLRISRLNGRMDRLEHSAKAESYRMIPCGVGREFECYVLERGE